MKISHSWGHGSSQAGKQPMLPHVNTKEREKEQVLENEGKSKPQAQLDFYRNSPEAVFIHN